MTEALRQMMEQSSETNVVKSPAARGAAPPVKSAAIMQPSSSGSGSLASPLTEQSFAAREYYPTGWTTTDGLFTMPAIKKVIFADPTSKLLELVFKAPT